MAMRDLATGGAACAVPGSSSSANPLAALANKLIGSSSKQHERLNEIPTSTPTISDNHLYSDTNEHLKTLPGSESDSGALSNAQNSDFLHGFRSADHAGFTNVWNEIQYPQASHFSERLYDGGVGSEPHSLFDGTPQRVLSSFLHSFIDSSREAIPFRPSSVPVLGLSEGDKRCIRDRSSIMARHIFADKSEDFINAQVNALLCSLDIDNDILDKGAFPRHFGELNKIWDESQNTPNQVSHPEHKWVAEYRQQNVEYADPNAWVDSFTQQHGANGWASEFDQEQSQLASLNQVNIPNIAAMEQSRLLAHTLAQNDDPKFQNSKFLQFVSKMSRGEVIIDTDSQLNRTELSAKNDWVEDYDQSNQNVDWAGQFAENQASMANERWVDEFSTEHGQHVSADNPWVDEFNNMHLGGWGDEFDTHINEGALGNSTADSWANAYDEFLNEQAVVKQNSRGLYVFSDLNPYVGHPTSLKQGQELFQKGLLSEAVLALEAEVLKNPENAEGWRLLGIAHAENDDDQQAIAAMMRAHEAVPTHLEVLLALGVSHTNELEQAAALKYLYSWLHHHPKYGALATSQFSDSLYYADVTRLFIEAAKMSPEDGDVHIVLGVLYNLSREYEKAVSSFRTALELRPNDYSLWNKLGATQANSVQCASAIEAYQQALDLKPNYVRAWANMGISYANQNMYEESIRYYVRAVAMNPKAENVWQYLRISLSHACGTDMMEAWESRNIDLLQKHFPLY